MRWLRWFGDHIGRTLLIATLWFAVVVVAYAAWVIWGGWDRESDLALAQALAPVAGAGFALVVVSAAVLAFRPPQPELSCFVRRYGEHYGTEFTVVNSGSLPASDVAIEIVGGSFSDGQGLELASPLWHQTFRDNPIQDGRDPPGSTYRTLLERSRALPNNSSEIVFHGSPGLPPAPSPAGVRIRVTASNAAAVIYEPTRYDWQSRSEWGLSSGATPRELLESEIALGPRGDEPLAVLYWWSLRYPLVRRLFVHCQLVRWRIFGGCPYSSSPDSRSPADEWFR